MTTPAGGPVTPHDPVALREPAAHHDPALPREPAPPRDRSAEIRDHLANERTLLAWQRTALALMGIGFLVDRFAFEGAGDRQLPAAILGLAIIGVGAVTAIVGVVRFLRTERDIDEATYRPSVLAHVLLAAAIVVGAVLLVLFLVLGGDP
jgi:putative membrane protein